VSKMCAPVVEKFERVTGQSILKTAFPAKKDPRPCSLLADDAGAKAGEFFTPPEVVDTLVRILEPRPGDTVYDPTSGSGGMLVHTASTRSINAL
jgi:type I restriction-modification system DNA methylase subunit